MPKFIKPHVHGRKLLLKLLASYPRLPRIRAWALTTLAITILIGGCTSGNKGDSDQPTLTVRQTQQWSQSCALCHVSGVGGAPTVGDASAWQPRLEQGEAQLLTHTLEGYANMPPLGYCMSCETEDFQAMIAWMSWSNL